LAEASLTILLKVSLPNYHIIESVVAVIEAALGALYKSASSPKTSPLPKSFKKVLVPFKILKHFYSPDSTIYNTLPASPSVMTSSPALT